MITSGSPTPGLPQPVVSVPPKIQAALGFISMMNYYSSQGEMDHNSHNEGAVNAALELLRNYFNGELEIADVNTDYIKTFIKIADETHQQQKEHQQLINILNLISQGHGDSKQSFASPSYSSHNNTFSNKPISPKDIDENGNLGSSI